MKKMKTTRYELNIVRPDLASERLKLAFLTDLHTCENGPENADLLAAIEEAQPDLILCGGDMLVGHQSYTDRTARELLLKLAAQYPVYHALGNHEARLQRFPHQYGPVYQEYRKALTEAGVVFLDNEQELICVHGIPLMISGYSLPKEAYTRFSRAKLDFSQIHQELGSPDPMALNILMAHTPEYMKAYTNWGADLTLCGHFHGGILRFGKHTGLISPNVKLFNRKCYGLYDFHQGNAGGRGIAENSSDTCRDGSDEKSRKKKDTFRSSLDSLFAGPNQRKNQDSYVIVSAGLGEHSLPLRIHNPRELVIVDVNVGKEPM